MYSKKIAIKTSKGMEFLKLEDILFCEAHGRYTKIVTIHGQEFLITRIIKELESVLPDEDFFRTHKSYIVNLNHIIKFHQNSDMAITMVNNIRVCLAKRRKHDFKARISELTNLL